MFRDEWDRKAHDIICIIKYGGRGGSVRTPDMHKIGDILRGGPPVMFAPPAPKAAVPPLAPPQLSKKATPKDCTYSFTVPCRKGE